MDVFGLSMGKLSNESMSDAASEQVHLTFKLSPRVATSWPLMVA